LEPEAGQVPVAATDLRAGKVIELLRSRPARDAVLS